MKQTKLFLAIAALLVSAFASAQVSVPEMTAKDPATYFKVYDNWAAAELVSAAAYTADKDSVHYYAKLDQTNNSAYIAITADKPIKAIRVLATGNGNNKNVCPGIIGYKNLSASEQINFAVADYAFAAEPVLIDSAKFHKAKWFTFDLSGQELKAVYIAKQWKNVVVGENSKANFPASSAQSFFAWGFQIALEGEELPEIVVPEPEPEPEPEPSSNVVLLEALFSNGAKGFITQPVDSTATPGSVEVPYLESAGVPTFVSGLNEKKENTAKVEFAEGKIVVTNGDAKAEYGVSFKGYSVADLEVGAAPYTFDGTEIGAWIASVYGWDAEKGIKFAKDVEDAGNRRISAGKDRVYFFLPAADSVKLVSGSGQNRPVKITINGVASDVKKTAKTGEDITIALPNEPAMVAIESDGNSGDAGFTTIQLIKAGEAPQPAEPKVTKFVIAGVEAVINQEAKTITAEVPFGTDVDAALAEATIEDNREDLEAALDIEAKTVTLDELVYTIVITIGAEPEPDVVLFEAIFSNGAKGFIDNKNGVNTVEVPYIGEVPSFVSGRIEEGEATVALEGDDKIVVTNGDAKAEYALSFKEYSVAPLEVGAPAHVFDSTEFGSWIASVYGWDAEKGVKFSKDVEDENNRRISEGKDRVYFFLPAADSVKLVSGKGENRPVKITVNGVASDVTKTAKKGEAITIALPNEPAMVAIESDGNSGDGGFTSIQLVKAGEAPQPAEPQVTKFVIAGVEAVIDQEAKTITAEVPFGTDVEVALEDALIEDNREDLEAVLDAEAKTVTLGELVYTLNITVAEKPVEPQPVGEAIFYWQAPEAAPANDDVLEAVGGTVTVKSTDPAKSVTQESATYNANVPEDMIAVGSKAWKFGGNALYLELRLSEGSFLQGDVISISGYNPWKISTSAEHTGDLVESLATGTAKGDYNVGSAILPADAEVIYLRRAEGTGTGIAAIKVTRGPITALVDNEASQVVFANGVVYNPAKVQLVVYNVNGAVVTMSKDNINLNTLPSGLYIVRDGNNVLKVVK